MERLDVGCDGKAECSPRGETTAKKLDPVEVEFEGFVSDFAAGLFAGAGAVDDRVAVMWDEGWVGDEIGGRNALGVRDDVWVGEDI